MIVIVDYGMGNIGSILSMLKKVGAQAQISSDSASIREADKLILPGVGSFDTGMANLRAAGLVEILEYCVQTRRVPALGICLGAQLLTRGSEEGSLPGLGWVGAETVKFSFGGGESKLRIPHMGWNFVRPTKDSDLFRGSEQALKFYFVHSYHFKVDRTEDVLAVTSYGYEFAAAFERGNIYGVQFHPEKSHKFGMRLLKNFADAV